MSKFEVLYYPNFEPSKKWIRSHLLFFDTVCSIIPEDPDLELSESILELKDEIPDSFKPIAPRNSDIKIDKLNIGILRNAFEEISNSKQNAFEEISNSKHNVMLDKVVINYSSDKISIPGRTFLHDDKLSHNVYDLLNDFNLIEKQSQEICNSIGANNFHLIDKRASNLIVSLVADNIAHSYGFNTITDQSLSFTVNCLNSFDYNALGDSRSLLSYSLTNCVIPQNIENLSIEEYVMIREKYENIREPFQEAIVNLNTLYRLENINDFSFLKEKIDEITQDFNSEIEKLKKSGIMSKIKQASSIGIGGLSTVGSATGNVEVPLIISVGSLIMQGFNLSRSNFMPQPSKTPVQRMLGNLQKDILEKSQIEALI